jgi:NADPH:quinone reductase-like Zn-dependent oxidoreductase
MKAVAIQTFGGPEGLAIIEIPEPVPGPETVLIDVEAVGVGGVDVVVRSGSLGDWGFQQGHIPGAEAAGTVTEVGPGADPAWVGRRVWAFTGAGGAYAERVVAPAAALVPLPDGLSASDAVTLGTSGIVARFGLRHARFAPGESVLVRGAAGGIGTMAVQLAARGGGAVAVTTSSVERGKRLRDLGAALVLGRAGDGADDAGFDVIIDVVAGAAVPAFFDRLLPNGRMVLVGATAGFPPPDFGAPLLPGFRKSMSFATFSADTVPEADRRAAAAGLFAAAARGELEAVVHEVLPLHQAAQAHQKMESGEVFGRIVLAPQSI